MKALPFPFALFCLIAPLACGPASAADPGYLDDRSDAAQLVHSLYNAINRHEYGRAWTYFGETKPAGSFDAFAKGYEETERVDVETGAVSSEGAAGSIYYQVPTAIRATGTDGGQHVFAGCYTARLANPQVQGEDFRPMQIEKGALKPADGELKDAVPESCGDGPPAEKKDSALEQAMTLFRAAYGEECQTLAPDAEPDATETESFEIAFKYLTDSDTDPESKVRLVKFVCGYGAYNSNEVYYLVRDGDETGQLQFATPDLDIRYENDDSDGKVEAIRVTGFHSEAMLVNSFYDPANRSLTSAPKWRGVGDASATGMWIFRDGKFSLVRYDVDASYDGEINPETVVDYLTGP